MAGPWDSVPPLRRCWRRRPQNERPSMSGRRPGRAGISEWQFGSTSDSPPPHATLLIRPAAFPCAAPYRAPTEQAGGEQCQAARFGNGGRRREAQVKHKLVVHVRRIIEEIDEKVA